jgi:L-Lysine epsilon oxidase N-terminal/L-lysine epsilon oxidase C-terminal domain
MAAIATIKIHPTIGIARLGNSPSEFFIGPEKPGVHPRPIGGYRDAQGRITRQAARFRLFGYDKNGKVVREITAKDATITWTVHLANKKAEWIKFQGPKLGTNKTLRRNATVTNRGSLIIDPGPRSLNGPNQHASFNTGMFLGTPVPLGDIRTDNQGRLLVLGGFGHSSSPLNTPIDESEFANNDGWHDDVSDGPVTATVKLKGNGAIVDAIGSWVICAAPKFAPPIYHVITLYDVLLQVAVDKLGLKVPAKPSFTKDIYPLLQRAIKMRWVSGMVAHPMHHADEHMPQHEQHHGDVAGPAHATLPAVIPPPASASARSAIFDKLRDPALSRTQSSGEADMPMIHSDFYPLEVNQPLTKTQYNMMKKWKDGNFSNDWSGPPAASPLITPMGLDRAALESCVGGAFYPGIEAGWMLRDTYTYSEPFRLDPPKLKAGDVTKQMAVPWQADFADCRQEGELAWWPAQRPDEVFPESGGPQDAWTRDIIGDTNSKSDMIQNWHRLGFIVKKGSKYVETQRKPKR